jgi:transcriptional regulator with XRE-family HTH domain
MRLSDSEQRLIDVIAATVRTSRSQFGWSQRELSRTSGVSQSRISSLERKGIRTVRLSEIDRLFSALCVRYWLGVEPASAIGGRQRDLVHARCAVHVANRLEAAGWLVQREVEIGSGRSHGWIDILAFNPRSGLLLVIEIKTEIRDFGAIERTLNWYQREAARAARRFGWRPVRVGSALLILHSRQNEVSISANRAAFRNGFPGRATGLRSVIDGSESAPVGRFVAMIDPRSRRSTWLRSTSVDGRRSAPPYEDYIDAVRQLIGGTSGTKRSPGRSPSTE